MTDYETKNLTGQETDPAPETVQPETPQPETVQNAAPSAPHLTLEPDPVPPEIPEAPAAAPSFHMPEPPRAPEPPKEEPVYQQAPPAYTQPPQDAPTYSAPQYGNPPPYQQAPYYQQNSRPLYNVPPVGYVQKSRLAAGLLAILFGTFGIHNYYLGFDSRGTIQLVVSLAGGLLTCGIATAAMAIWGFIEGVLILSATNPARQYDGNGVILKD